MFSLFRVYGFAIVTGISLVLSSGCNGDKPEAEHPHEHGENGEHTHHSEALPKTFVAAAHELEEHAPKIKAAFEADEPGDADASVHHIGRILAVMPELIDSSDLTDDKKAQAKEASETLFDQYNKLDEIIHGTDTESKYADVGGKIDEALAKLEALVPAGADHDDHDDDHAGEDTP